MSYQFTSLRLLRKSASASANARIQTIFALVQAGGRRGIISTFGPGLRKTYNQMQMESEPAAAIFEETKRVFPR